MQKLVAYSGDSDFSHGMSSIYTSPMDSSIYLSLGCHVEVYSLPCKRSRISAPFVFNGKVSKKPQTTIDALPDECLFEIFRRLNTNQERSSCASVSKHWLMLLSTIRRDEISLIKSSNADLDEEKAELSINGHLTRCLEGKKATDIRLAAIAVGTGSRGGLGKLSICGKNKNTTCGVTNFGLKAVSRGCPSLRDLSLWNLRSVTDEGLVEIAKECRLLENLDLSHIPKISDKSLIAIANNCPNLTSLSLESCADIGNEGLQAIGQNCRKLKSVSIKNCPLVGDQGIASLVSSASYSLTKLKLQALNISDVSLAVIGHYGIAISDLVFTGLQKVTEKGFWVMGNGHGLQKLTSLAINACFGVTDLGIDAISKGCPNLKHFLLRKCTFLSDSGLLSFSKSAISLETLLLEECHWVSQLGIFPFFSKLKTLTLANCFGINDSCSRIRIPTGSHNSLKSLSVSNCPGFGNASLAFFGQLCPQLQNVELTGLYGITDNGFTPLIENSEAGLTTVNLTSCVNITDKLVSEITKLHGGTLEVLTLNGCQSVTDSSLVAISDNCLLLNELDVSECSITDSGLTALAQAIQLNLQILSISRCSLVSDKSFSFLMRLGETLSGLNIKQCSGISSSAVGLLIDQLWNCDILS